MVVGLRDLRDQDTVVIDGRHLQRSSGVNLNEAAVAAWVEGRITG